MKNLSSLCLRVEDHQIKLLDQTRLPQEEVWLTIESVEQMVRAIYQLQVRGAPAIGVAAALALAQFAQRERPDLNEVQRAAQQLRAARPTAVNLMNALDRMLAHQTANCDVLVGEAIHLFEEDVALCEGMAQQGAPLVQSGEGILTHCNTGGLATVGIGTALGVIRRAHEEGKKIHVYVDETRPLLQGGRLTAWECQKLGIPYTLITDNMAAALMKEGRIQRVFVGSDRVASNGDFANKIGTYSVAVNAHYHGIPFHPVAPRTTIDPLCPSGAKIPIEERPAEEVWGVPQHHWAPAGAPVRNPAFDVTPAELITSFVFDHGVFGPEKLQQGAHLV